MNSFKLHITAETILEDNHSAIVASFAQRVEAIGAELKLSLYLLG